MSNAVSAALLVFPVRYFGFMGGASAHRFVPSLVGAVVWGGLFGPSTAGFEEWGRRRAERDEG